LERTGLISRYVTLLDAGRLGLGISVIIQIRLEKQIERALEVFEAAMQRYPEVMECYLMSGDSDYLIRVVVRDVPSLSASSSTNCPRSRVSPTSAPALR